MKRAARLAAGLWPLQMLPTRWPPLEAVPDSRQTAPGDPGLRGTGLSGAVTKVDRSQQMVPSPPGPVLGQQTEDSERHVGRQLC